MFFHAAGEPAIGMGLEHRQGDQHMGKCRLGQPHVGKRPAGLICYTKPTAPWLRSSKANIVLPRPGLRNRAGQIPRGVSRCAAPQPSAITMGRCAVLPYKGDYCRAHGRRCGDRVGGNPLTRLGLEHDRPAAGQQFPLRRRRPCTGSRWSRNRQTVR